MQLAKPRLLDLTTLSKFHSEVIIGIKRLWSHFSCTAMGTMHGSKVFFVVVEHRVIETDFKMCWK